MNDFVYNNMLRLFDGQNKEIEMDRKMERKAKKVSKRRVHRLKLQKRFADAIFCGQKPFEVRKNDRDFRIGDFVIFNVLDVDTHPLNGCVYEICYILNGGNFGIDPEYVVFSIRLSKLTAQDLLELVKGNEKYPTN